jgi:hypothetical protein
VPTYEALPAFRDEYRALTPEQQRLFQTALAKFIADLNKGTFRKGLRVKAIRGIAGVYEMTWAPDVRATFEYGPSLGRGPHIIWRRIGTHDIFKRP